MSNTLRIAVPALLLAAIAGGGYWLYQKSQGTGEVTPVSKPIAPPVQEPVTPPPTNVVAEAPPVEQQKPQSDRVAVTPVGNRHDDAPQGVKGRVVLPNGAPAAEIPIFLIESMMNDPIGIFLMSKSGKTLQPISWGTTGADGTFALGVYTAGKSYDLRVASNEHPEINHQSIKVREEDWFDTGDLPLDNGLVLAGRVVDEFTKGGIANATVYLTNTNQAHIAVPTPGRERGIAAVTDNVGGFRFGNAPTTGMVNLLAEAEGYASTTLTNHQLQNDSGKQLLLEISRGQPIAGIVVDGTGEPLANVQVTAQGLSQKTPQTATTNSSSLGTFEFPSLREGPYQLVATSNAYAETKTPPVVTGETDVKLVLTQRPWVKLRVRGSKNEPIKAYRISLKRHFPNNPLGIGNVPEFQDRSITPADYSSQYGGEWAIVRGLPAGSFVFQIQDKSHAKSLSAAFTVEDSPEPVEVEAQLTLGAAITGTVIDDAGQPVRNATVTTDMNGAFSGAGGIFDIFRSMIPERHTTSQARTDGQGRFRLEKLAFADYMVRISHADFCEGSAMNITLAEEGQVLDVGTVQLSRGTNVEGFTTLGGRALGQVKVTLSLANPETPVVSNENAPREPVAMPFSASVISDNDGRFRLLKRVPPGTYKVQAARSSGEQNPFMTLLDMKHTEITITLAPGQDRQQVDFDLPAR